MHAEPDPAAMSVDARPPVVDFAVLGRRLRRTAMILGALVLTVTVIAIPVRGVDGVLFMNLVGLALGLMFLAEVVIVGGSAVRGLLRAGERGDRLASDGVGLLPPQMLRRQAGPADVSRDAGPDRTS